MATRWEKPSHAKGEREEKEFLDGKKCEGVRNTGPIRKRGGKKNQKALKNNQPRKGTKIVKLDSGFLGWGGKLKLENTVTYLTPKLNPKNRFTEGISWGKNRKKYAMAPGMEV